MPPTVRNLNLYLDESGLLRSRGRLDKCMYLDHNVKNPLLLSKNSHLTDLIISYYHDKCKHLGAKTTLSLIRNSGYWIPHGRNKVKSLVSKCITCKKINACAFKYPKPRDLPASRVNFIRPYENTGLDYTGHIFLKLGNETVKMYILLFTCLHVRCIHLE